MVLLQTATKLLLFLRLGDAQAKIWKKSKKKYIAINIMHHVYLCSGEFGGISVFPVSMIIDSSDADYSDDELLIALRDKRRQLLAKIK